MFDDIAESLAADPWVTRDRVERWIAIMEKDPAVKKLAPCLAANLRKHREPSAAPDPDADRDDGNRYISGAYAEFIRH